jgi:hypothetical protein
MFFENIFGLAFSYDFVRILNLCINKLSIIQSAFIMNMGSILNIYFLFIFRIFSWILGYILFQRCAIYWLIYTTFDILYCFPICYEVVWIFNFILQPFLWFFRTFFFKGWLTLFEKSIIWINVFVIVMKLTVCAFYYQRLFLLQTKITFLLNVFICVYFFIKIYSLWLYLLIFILFFLWVNYLCFFLFF